MYIQIQFESLSKNLIKSIGPRLESGIKDPILKEEKRESVPEGSGYHTAGDLT